MAYTLDNKDRQKMRTLGETIRGYYKTAKGVPFHKDFTDEEHFEKFTLEAAEVGTKLVCIIAR